MDRRAGLDRNYEPMTKLFIAVIERTLQIHGKYCGDGLDGLPLRASFSPAHPLAHRDVPLARARVFGDRALREHRRPSSLPSHPPSKLACFPFSGKGTHVGLRAAVKCMSLTRFQRGSWHSLHCAHRGTTALSWGLCEHRD
jgi:hypothetical protein